jgi:signal peptidase I
MAPTYQRGDWLLVRRFVSGQKGKVQVGEVLLIEREEQPGILFIKRLTGIRGDSPNRHYPTYWVEGDNKALSQDSRTWGALVGEEIVGKVLFRCKRKQRAS